MAEAVAVVAAKDRFGLGWRGPLAAGILSSLEQLDCLEIIAEQYAHLPQAQRRSLQYLSRQIPISLHGVSLGLAGSTPPPQARMETLARLGDELQAETISEHLSFVRAQPEHSKGSAIEIGHLAAPPRNYASVERACEAIHKIQRLSERPLLVENIPSLITPFGSDLTESQWLRKIAQNSQAPFLLDLENLYANAANRGENPFELLLELPLSQVHTVHLSGGRWVDIPYQNTTERRFLDDHRQDILPTVFELLALLAAHAPQNLTVIIERDGNYPAMHELLAQLSQAKAAVAYGRQNAKPCARAIAQSEYSPSTNNIIENKRIEYLLAELFCDAHQRQLFMIDPVKQLESRNLAELTVEIERLDWAGLLLMARSVAAKNHSPIIQNSHSQLSEEIRF